MTGPGEGGCVRSQIIQPQESLILYESFNTLSREVRKVEIPADGYETIKTTESVGHFPYIPATLALLGLIFDQKQTYCSKIFKTLILWSAGKKEGWELRIRSARKVLLGAGHCVQKVTKNLTII